jgi:hypothetical protein
MTGSAGIPPVLLTASSRPEQNCQNDHPNDTPANPCDVRMSCLPFEDFLMDGHYCNAPNSLTRRLKAPNYTFSPCQRTSALVQVSYGRSTLMILYRGSSSLLMTRIKPGGKSESSRKSATVSALTARPRSTSTLMSSGTRPRHARSWSELWSLYRMSYVVVRRP